jgi:hypothetical protein
MGSALSRHLASKSFSKKSDHSVERRVGLHTKDQDLPDRHTAARTPVIDQNSNILDNRFAQIARR